jgi:hypothetical protein
MCANKNRGYQNLRITKKWKAQQKLSSCHQKFSVSNIYSTGMLLTDCDKYLTHIEKHIKLARVRVRDSDLALNHFK